MNDIKSEVRSKTDHAYLVEGSYPDGYGRRHLDKPFWTVHCDSHAGGGRILNSGHHYTEDVLEHAHALVATHDAAEHGA